MYTGCGGVSYPLFPYSSASGTPMFYAFHPLHPPPPCLVYVCVRSRLRGQLVFPPQLGNASLLWKVGLPGLPFLRHAFVSHWALAGRMGRAWALAAAVSDIEVFLLGTSGTLPIHPPQNSSDSEQMILLVWCHFFEHANLAYKAYTRYIKTILLCMVGIE